MSITQLEKTLNAEWRWFYCFFLPLSLVFYRMEGCEMIFVHCVSSTRKTGSNRFKNIYVTFNLFALMYIMKRRIICLLHIILWMILHIHLQSRILCHRCISIIRFLVYLDFRFASQTSSSKNDQLANKSKPFCEAISKAKFRSRIITYNKT